MTSKSYKLAPMSTFSHGWRKPKMQMIKISQMNPDPDFISCTKHQKWRNGFTLLKRSILTLWITLMTWHQIIKVKLSIISKHFLSICHLGNDVSGVYKYPQNCEKSNCVYFVEWKTFGENVHFTIITKNQDSISIGLSTAEHSVSLLRQNSEL